MNQNFFIEEVKALTANLKSYFEKLSQKDVTTDYFIQWDNASIRFRFKDSSSEFESLNFSASLGFEFNLPAGQVAMLFDSERDRERFYIRAREFVLQERPEVQLKLHEDVYPGLEVLELAQHKISDQKDTLSN